MTLTADTFFLELRRLEFYRDALTALLVSIKLGPLDVDRYRGRKVIERRVLVHHWEEMQAQIARVEHQAGLARIFAPINGVLFERYERGAPPCPWVSPCCPSDNWTSRIGDHLT